MSGRRVPARAVLHGLASMVESPLRSSGGEGGEAGLRGKGSRDGTTCSLEPGREGVVKRGSPTPMLTAGGGCVLRANVGGEARLAAAPTAT